MFRSSIVFAIILLLCGCVPSPPATALQDFSAPASAYKSFLVAVKADDEAAAMACWWISDGNRSGALDVIVGSYTVNHRSGTLLARRFGDAAKPYIDEISQYSDEALDRQLEQLPQAVVQVRGDTATIKIGDSSDLHPCRKVNGKWKLDANAWAGLKDPADFFAAGSWAAAITDILKYTRELNADLEQGRYKSFDEFKAAVETKGRSLEKRLHSSSPPEK